MRGQLIPKDRQMILTLSCARLRESLHRKRIRLAGFHLQEGYRIVSLQGETPGLPLD